MELAAASVSRSVDLPVSVEEAWSSLRDADGLAGWLGDAVDLDAAPSGDGRVVPGAAGTVREGDVVRRVVITEVEVGRSIELAWWDEAAPEEASIVTIALVPVDDDTTSVVVTERLAGAATATASLDGASVHDLVGASEPGWDRRLRALLGEPARSGACV
jgi:uncharacterized protein YndB with AHSA1/START domain